MENKNDGFTLVELSIVIVIIGLIVSGVLAGQNLVQQSNLRNIVTTANKYKVAANTFKMTYNALPGDIKNASSYWPTCSNSDADDCNGDGNGKYSQDALNTSIEGTTAFEHLSLAGLIEGSYVNNGGSSPTGTNTPKSSFRENIICYEFYFSTQATTFSKQANDNVFEIAGDGVDNICRFSVLYTKEAYGIDLKYDDGLIYTGKIFGVTDANNGSCRAGGSNTYNLNYAGSATNPGCGLQFFLD